MARLAVAQAEHLGDRVDLQPLDGACEEQAQEEHPSRWDVDEVSVHLGLLGADLQLGGYPGGAAGDAGFPLLLLSGEEEFLSH